jgi:hypothetical protein
VQILSETWRPSLLLRILLWWTSIIFVTAWLPLIRCVFDGPTYEWGTSYFGYSFSGAGLAGDLWLPIAKTSLGLAILALGWRGARAAFGYLLVGWQAFGLADALHLALTRPDAFRFRGDTLGIDISLSWLAPALYALALVLAVTWLVRERDNGTAAPVEWTSLNYRGLAALGAFLPVQFVLLRYGPVHGLTDQIGVVLTILQWFLIPVAIQRPSSAVAHER